MNQVKTSDGWTVTSTSKKDFIERLATSLENREKFGKVVATAGIAEARVPNDVITALMLRHLSGDWGDLCEEDKKLNDHTFLNQDGGRLHSSYENAYEGKTIWIMTSGFGNDSTDPNMCHTCIMYPNEY